MHPDLRALLEFWAPVLRVQDWQIEASYDPKLAALGVCYPDHVYRRARIVIAPEQDDVEASLVHELLHLHFAPFETEGGSAERTEEERAVESLMRGYIDLRRSGVPATQVQSRARAAFEARLRQKSSQGHGAPERKRTRMDLTMFLAALKAALAAEDPAAAKSQIEALVAEAEKAAAGDEMPAPPMSAPSPEDPSKPPMMAAPPGAEEKKPDGAMRQLEARLRALESTAAEAAKNRAAEAEKARAALYAENEARVPEAARPFAKGLGLEQLTGYLRTLPERAPAERSAGPTRGPGRTSSADPERLARMRQSMGIPDTTARLPGRDERGRRTWPVNAPSALRKALTAGDGGVS